MTKDEYKKIRSELVGYERENNIYSYVDVSIDLLKIIDFLFGAIAKYKGGITDSDFSMVRIKWDAFCAIRKRLDDEIIKPHKLDNEN